MASTNPTSTPNPASDKVLQTQGQAGAKHKPKAARTKPKARTDVPVAAKAEVIDAATQLTGGGRLVYRRTHRCIATCNLVARLAGFREPEAC